MNGWPITARLRCRAFAGQGARLNLLRCDGPDAPVMVWDDVAGHYTHCHSLSDATQVRLRAKMYRVIRLGVTR